MMRPPMKDSLPPLLPAAFNWFGWYARRYLARHFHAVRLAGERPRLAPDSPVVIYLNHPSWWDPLVCIAMAQLLFPRRSHYAPIDAEALGKYGIFRRLGFFPVEKDSLRGAALFLRSSIRILEQPGAVLWITPGGEFADPRERPVRLRPGLAHLARRMRAGQIIPMAIEYPFWQERTPESLVRFGDALYPAAVPEQNVAHWQELLADKLAKTQDALASPARARTMDSFQTLIDGRTGVGGVYDLWRRTHARIRGEAFRGDHGA